jgi:hypothetical protein
MTWRSHRPHGRLFTMYEVRISALPRDDADAARIGEALHTVEIQEALASLAARIEEACPDVRVDIV